MTPTPLQRNEKVLEAFDEKFGKIGPEGNCDSIGRGAGCDDCVSNIMEREKHREFLISALATQRQEVLEEVSEAVKESQEWLQLSSPMGEDSLAIIRMEKFLALITSLKQRP